MGQLREGHAKKLVQACERLNAMVTVVAFNAFIKFIDRQKFHQLRKDSSTAVHRNLPLKFGG
jgi:hypothetical protein